MDVLKEALKRIKPSKAEEKKVNAIASAIIKKINIPGAVPALGGSFAKGTWLKGNHDIDIYVRFSKKRYSGKDISLILGQVLRKQFRKVETLHGSRDYFQIIKKPYTIEIVPIIEVGKADLAENITDVSPLHVEWVSHHKHLMDDMRLAKAFFKANKLYGAESYIKGFSGYVLEILSVYYSGFGGLISNIANWDISKKIVIDIEGYHKGKPIVGELNKAKLFSPLILIDPVQKERNAAAGLSHEVFEKAVVLARSFIEKPSLKFFEKEKITKALLKKKAGKNLLVLIEAKPLEGKKDIVGAKLLKCVEFFRKKLFAYEFKLIGSGWAWEKNALFWFIVDKDKLPEKRMHYGPPVGEKERLENFKKVWKGHKLMEEDGRAFVIVKRKFRDAKSLLKKLAKNEYVKERIKAVNVL